MITGGDKDDSRNADITGKDTGKVTGKDTGNVTKQSLSWDQVGTKLGLSRDQVEKLLLSAIQATSAAEIRQVMNMTNESNCMK